MTTEPANPATRRTGMTARVTRIAVVLFASSLLAAGCAKPGTTGPGAFPTGTAVGIPSSGPVVGPSVPAPSPSASGACSTAVIIRAEDEGKTVCVAVGGTVDIFWKGLNAAPESSGDALTLVPIPMPEQSLRYKANAPGTETFTGARRACTPSPGQMSCGALMVWTVTVEVK